MPTVKASTLYRKQLERLLDEMHKSIDYWLKAAYKTNQPEIAQDASPAVELQSVMNKIIARWRRKFKLGAPALAKYFTLAMKDRSDRQLQQILKDAGFSIPFKMTRQMNDVMRATMNEQVSLITNLSTNHLAKIEGLVMRSVTEGRNLHDLSVSLQKQYSMTKRRAALIARDQNNKATATMNRVRQDELGIEEAIWMHSNAGKTQRPTHVANDGKRYKIKDGWYDPAVGKRIWPGTEINCRCVSRSVIPGFA